MRWRSVTKRVTSTMSRRHDTPNDKRRKRINAKTNTKRCGALARIEKKPGGGRSGVGRSSGGGGVGGGGGSSSSSRRRRGRRRRRRRRERRRARRAGHRRGPQGLRAGRRGRPGRTLSICSRSVSSLHPIDETGGPCLGGQGGTAKSGHLVHFGLAYLHLAWISLG